MSEYLKSLNPHYDFSNSGNLAEIEKQSSFETAFFAGDWKYVHEAEALELGGASGYKKGLIIQKDWGSNEVVDFYKQGEDDVCIKNISVKPCYMLSLQSHLGRAEKWEVLSGLLTAIVDGHVFEISKKGCFDVTKSDALKIHDGNYIELPKSSIHCMINRHDDVVVVQETQTGKTYEADNKRFIDQIRDQDKARPTIPLSSENHYKSALLYWKIERDIAQKAGWKTSFDPSILKKPE